MSEADTFFEKGCRQLRLSASDWEKGISLALVIWHGSGLVRLISVDPYQGTDDSWLSSPDAVFWEFQQDPHFGDRWIDVPKAVATACQSCLDLLERAFD